MIRLTSTIASSPPLAATICCRGSMTCSKPGMPSPISIPAYHWRSAPASVVSANAYLGRQANRRALGGGVIVITGRVADASLTLGPAVHEFGWSWDDWDRLCAGTVAGHLIECGAQATGGLWCNWQEVPDLANVGYPLVEMAEDGTFTITKPPLTGGR